ncbi:sensor histidine kinase [Nocardia terpenica]|nr:HAMP domain-containing sensor histidine kinase [Nocardia terpenica]
MAEVTTSAVPQGRSLRARIQTAIVAVTVLSVALFVGPLATSIQRVHRTNAVTELQRDAFRVASVVPDTVGSDVTVGYLLPDLPEDRTVGIYSTDGQLLRERGPMMSTVAAAAADGRTHAREEGADLAVSAPVPSERSVAATVRVSIPYDQVLGNTRRAWMLMALLGVAAIGLAVLLARYEGRRIAEPLERLTESAQALGDGDFTIHPERSRIIEADALGRTLEGAAGRLKRLLDRERAFSTQVSHQLRTPLTALLLGLESALMRTDADMRKAASVALRRGERLESTIEDLLRLARETDSATRPPLAVADLLETVVYHWQPAFAEHGRFLRIVCAPDLPRVDASATAIQHVVEVLIENALVHGDGATTVHAHTVAGNLLIEVSDQGPGVADPDRAFAARSPDTDTTHGIGLSLARALAESEGCRLMLRQAVPPIFTLQLPPRR